TVFELQKAGDVAARPRQALDKACAYRIGGEREHDRHRTRRLEQLLHGWAASGKNDVRRAGCQFRRVFPSLVDIAAAPAVIDPSIAPVDPAQLRQRLHEYGELSLRSLIVSDARERADAPHALALLGARRERPRGRTAEQGDELPAFHSISSSASPANGSGTVSPRALAILRLMTRVYLSARWIGKSPGFAPLRMRST